MKKEALRVTATIPVAPTTLYFACLDSEQHTAMTGGKAQIEPGVGTKFTAWDGYITGKLMALDLGRRIIMSWRTTEFPSDVGDSRVEIHLEAFGGNTRVTILHTDIPEGQAERYKAGWQEHYFDPMRRYFSQYLPDPRNPPPPRPPPPPMDEEEEEEEAPKGKKGGEPKPAPKPPPPKKPAPTPAKKPAPTPAKKPAPTPAKKPAKKAPPPKKTPAAKKPAKKAPPPKKTPAAKKPAKKK